MGLSVPGATRESIVVDVCMYISDEPLTHVINEVYGILWSSTDPEKGTDLAVVI